VLAEISQLKAKNVIILGGTGVVSDAVMTALQGTYVGGSTTTKLSVTRLSGADRYATAAAVAAAVQKGSFSGNGVSASWATSSTMILVTGLNYPDALAMGSYAGMNKVPILFANATGLPTATTGFISSAKITSAIAVGAVCSSPTIMSALSSAGVTAANTKQIVGADRYATAAGVANTLFSNNWGGGVSAAIGSDFADALTGGALSAQAGYPMLLLAPGTGLNAAEQAYVRASQPQTVYVYGGTGVVTNVMISSITSMINN
jgi:putative cell wall-binding protein